MARITKKQMDELQQRVDDFFGKGAYTIYASGEYDGSRSAYILDRVTPSSLGRVYWDFSSNAAAYEWMENVMREWQQRYPNWKKGERGE